MMVKLHSHSKDEEPVMLEVVHDINVLLVSAQEKGLSLSGGINCLIHAMTMLLVMAYDDNKTRKRVAADIPDVISAYLPQWERIVEREHPERRAR